MDQTVPFVETTQIYLYCFPSKAFRNNFKRKYDYRYKRVLLIFS